MRKLIDRLLLRLIPWLGYRFIRGIRWTMRIQEVNSEIPGSIWKSGGHCIVAFWHGRQLMMPVIYGGDRVSILVSRHRDGELIARTVRYFGFEAARGSTTRGGGMALRSLVRTARSGSDIGVTPDGPRGPREVVQKGVIELAKLTGLPILPATFDASKKKSLRPGIGL